MQSALNMALFLSINYIKGMVNLSDGDVSYRGCLKL